MIRAERDIGHQIARQNPNGCSRYTSLCAEEDWGKTKLNELGRQNPWPKGDACIAMILFSPTAGL